MTRWGHTTLNRSDRDARTLTFILRAGGHGARVDEESSLPGLWHNGRRTAEEVRTLARRHRARMKETVRVAESLSHVHAVPSSMHRNEKPVSAKS